MLVEESLGFAFTRTDYLDVSASVFCLAVETQRADSQSAFK